LKYGAGTGVDVWGSVTCKTGPYCPAILTAMDDNTVGETISGSTGNPSGYYGSPAINMEGAPGTYQYLRVAHHEYGLFLPDPIRFPTVSSSTTNPLCSAIAARSSRLTIACFGGTTGFLTVEAARFPWRR